MIREFAFRFLFTVGTTALAFVSVLSFREELSQELPDPSPEPVQTVESWYPSEVPLCRELQEENTEGCKL